MKRFDDKTCPEPTTGCLLWTASTTEGGYGRFGLGQRVVIASRFAWERAHGPIPAGLDVCHRCDTPACVRVDHLFLGTRAENVADMHAKGRGRAPGMQGERHPQAKLTAEVVRQIRSRRQAGESGVSLAKAYGVTPALITMVARRRIWKEVA